MIRSTSLLLFVISAGCVDGDALRRGLVGERAAPPVDGGAADADPPDRRTPPDARPPRDAALPDMAPDPRCVPEACNDVDDDCDGSIDEGVADCCVPGTRRACGVERGVCTVGEQFCTVDLEWSACTGDPPGREVCDGAVDEDCDGQVDEDLVNACGACGPLPDEICNTRDDDCDGTVDEGVLNACGACGDVPAEQPNRRDDDCDGAVDEGLLNACGELGDPPPEVCNGRDDDCDEQVDEEVLNACGACGAVPEEICNGVDDDCDDRVDEDTIVNACGGCGLLEEICNGADDDCDGAVDEGACRAFVLDSREGVWRTPPRLNSGEIVTEGRVSAIFTTVEGGERMWAVVGRALWGYDISADRWLNPAVPGQLEMASVEAAFSVPAWWRSRQAPTEYAAVTVLSGRRFQVYEFHPVQLDLAADFDGDLDENWARDRNAPAAFPLTAAVIDLHDANDYWPGDAGEVCEGGPAGPVGGVVTNGRLYTHDAASCHLFMDERPVGTWRGFDRRGAPPVEHLVAWDFVSRSDGTGMHIVILSQPDPRGR